jgi:hypothetical protein
MSGVYTARQWWNITSKIIGDDTEPDPALHSVFAAVPASAQSMTALEGTDTSLATGAPAQGRAGGAGPRGSGMSRPGSTLSEGFRMLRPGARVLFMTGYETVEA